MDWITAYPKNKKPAYSELLDFFRPDVRELFLRFDREVNAQFGVHNKYHRFSKTAGWTYGYGRNYSCELLSVAVDHEFFCVLGVTVKNGAALEKALKKAQIKYDEGFEERYAAICERKRKDQTERSKRRVAREKTEMDSLTQNLDHGKFNQFKWCKKISRNDLLRLYESEAAGMLDEELLDEVGFAFYTRCKQAHEARSCMESGKILCHHCGAAPEAGRVSPTGSTLVKNANKNLIISCECGYTYTYREYRRSYMAVNMPGNRAAPIFEYFEQKWPGCKDASQKMLLIDWLIHECHVTLMSGSQGKSVCENLIEGTRKQITELILKLAYDAPEKNLI